MDKNRYKFSSLILALSFSLSAMGCEGGGIPTERIPVEMEYPQTISGLLVVK